MNLIIHHLTAWQLACNKYQFAPVETPQSWPVLVSFPQAADEEALVPAAVMTVDMAAKFMSACTTARLGQVDKTTMTKLALTMPKSNKTPMKVGMGQVKVPEAEPTVAGPFTAIDQETGDVATLSGFSPAVQFKVGQIVNFNGHQYIITGTSSIIQGVDPIDGTEGALIVADEPSNIPGIEEIPMDPSKMDQGDKIADLGDPTEHVLDVERSI